MFARLWEFLGKPGAAPPEGGSDTIESSLAAECDTEFLREVYAVSRRGAADLVNRHPDSLDAVIDAEFASRQRSYLIDFPGVMFFVLRQHGQPIGRLYLQHTPEVIFVVDLILLPPWRGRGLGTRLLQALAREAVDSGRNLRLHVHKSNDPAIRLYRRLGFQIIADAATHHLMEWAP